MDTSRRRSAEIYLRFLQLANAMRGLPSLPSLDPLEERILSFVAIHGKDNVRLSVRDIMAVAELGSPSTVHTRLKSMRTKGWLILTDTDDVRRKQVALSEPALLHFEELSRCIVNAVEG